MCDNQCKIITGAVVGGISFIVFIVLLIFCILKVSLYRCLCDLEYGLARIERGPIINQSYA